MVLEFLASWYAASNGFFLTHVNFVSHVMAAVFLVLSESTITYRLLSPIMDWIEDTVFPSTIVLPNFAATAFFITWATFSIVIYQFIFKFLLGKYQNHASLIVMAAFLLTGYMVNVKYRD